VDYARDVQPILTAHCVRCHGPRRQKAGLRLDSAAAIYKGTDHGAVLTPGDSAHSLLMAVLSGPADVPRMPPSGEPVEPQQIAILKTWIDAGAPSPDKFEQEPAARAHWAFRPPVRPPLPALRDPKSARNPVDAFLASERERKGFTPSPPAPTSLLLRRVYLDLIGLPPSREELRTFLADRSDTAYERVVDRLLESPQYGERWGRHWMDVWRYSDPDGRKAKADIWWSNDNLWRWRDWIIRSLNADKGYDRMVLEMLAGDELAPEDPEALVATGFLVRNYFKLDRNIWLNNTIEHTSKAFLGLSLHCARCHDHKFDPISQKDYYRFRAFFEPHDISPHPPQAEGERTCAAITHVYDKHPEAPTWLFVRGDERSPDRGTPIAPGVPPALGTPSVSFTPKKPPSEAGPTSTGRRLALARWLCDRQNPLPVRVAVNHIWSRHFGRPLVENVCDFGLRSKPPVQQALLDWLSVEFMDHDWSMKWLHRLLVTSAAYRMQSAVPSSAEFNAAVDPDNQYYWRMNSRRMEAEVVRDALLYLGGDIDWTMGGSPLDCLAGPSLARRSLYHRSSREDRMEFLMTFDAASVDDCYRRQESIVPQQALALENSPFTWDQARRIFDRLDAELRRSSPTDAGVGTDSASEPAEEETRPEAVPARAFVTAAFEHILGRTPKAEELESCERFLADQEHLLRDPAHLTAFPISAPRSTPPANAGVPGLPLTVGDARKLPPVQPAADPEILAREYLVHALLNHNDFITIR
jgi:hypothetical protein